MIIPKAQFSPSASAIQTSQSFVLSIITDYIRQKQNIPCELLSLLASEMCGVSSEPGLQAGILTQSLRGHGEYQSHSSEGCGYLGQCIPHSKHTCFAAWGVTLR